MYDREVNWCPSGEGYLPYCPQPSDPDSYKYCCTSYYFGSTKPSCCLFPLSVGSIIAIICGLIVLFSLLIFLGCWCWPTSPLNRRRKRNQTSEGTIREQVAMNFRNN